MTRVKALKYATLRLHFKSLYDNTESATSLDPTVNESTYRQPPFLLLTPDLAICTKGVDAHQPTSILFYYRLDMGVSRRYYRYLLVTSENKVTTDCVGDLPQTSKLLVPQSRSELKRPLYRLIPSPSKTPQLKMLMGYRDCGSPSTPLSSSRRVFGGKGI